MKTAETPRAPKSLDQVLDVIEGLPKDSAEFQRIRNRVFSKVIVKEAKPELANVFKRAIRMHGWQAVHVAYLALKRQQPPQKRQGKANNNGKTQ